MAKTKLLVLTDVGRDNDDELTFVLIAALIKLGLVDLLGVITTLNPSDKRAKLVKGILDTLGIPGAPISVGTNIDERYKTQDYEFDATYLSKENNFERHDELLKRVFEQAEDNSIDFLMIAGLTDAKAFIENNLELCIKKLKRVVIMGGLATEQDKVLKNKDGFLMPDDSYNNFIDLPASKVLYELLQKHHIPITILSRYAVRPCSLSPEYYQKLAATKSPVGERLNKAQPESIKHLWRRVFLQPDDIEREGLPDYCTPEWFIKSFTDLKFEDTKLTVDDDVWPYVTKLNAYDPIALLATIFPELFEPEKIMVDNTEHQDIGINTKKTGVKDPALVRQYLLELALLGLTTDYNTLDDSKFKFFKKKTSFPEKKISDSSQMSFEAN